jgi:hypothetical protein
LKYAFGTKENNIVDNNKFNEYNFQTLESVLNPEPVTLGEKKNK